MTSVSTQLLGLIGGAVLAALGWTGNTILGLREQSAVDRGRLAAVEVKVDGVDTLKAGVATLSSDVRSLGEKVSRLSADLDATSRKR